MDHFPRPRTAGPQPPTGPQLTAIVKALILAEPTRPFSDLFETIKLEVLRQGYDYPSHDALSLTLRRLEQEWRRTQRVVPVLGLTGPPRRRQPLTQADPPWRQRRAPSGHWTSVTDLSRPGVDWVKQFVTACAAAHKDVA